MKRVSRAARAGAIAAVALASTSCAFLRTANFDWRGDSYDVLTTRIDELQAARGAGVGYLAWVDHSHAAREIDEDWRIHVFHSVSSWSRPNIDDDASWDLALGVLHARRASSLARLAPTQSFTMTWIGWMECDRRKTDGSWIGVVVGSLLMAPATVPMDLILVPVTFTSGFVRDLGVDSATRERVRVDLECARARGIEQPEQWMWSQTEPETGRSP